MLVTMDGLTAAAIPLSDWMRIPLEMWAPDDGTEWQGMFDTGERRTAYYRDGKLLMRCAQRDVPAPGLPYDRMVTECLWVKRPFRWAQLPCGRVEAEV